MDITIIRHGTTTLNEKGCYQGSNVNPGLSESGRLYAEKVAANFDPTNFDLVISSPLNRAVETAEILVKGNKGISLDKRIQEINFGEIDGKVPGSLKTDHPEVFDYHGLSTDKLGEFVEGVETWAQVETRLASFFDELIEKYSDENILIFCHGGIIRAMLAHFFGGTPINYDQVANVSETKIHLDEKQNYYARLVEYNRVLA